MLTNTHRRSSGAAALGVALLLMTGLTGCFPAETAETATSSPTASDITGLPEGVQQATDVPTDVPNDPDVRGDVELTTCEEAEGGWRASGTASNSGTSTKDYTITVFFTTEGGTVIGAGDTELSVAAGESSEWSVTGELTPAPTTNCVLRGVG
ncbi:hypothetical protein [Microbacterium sulfonylureivorans]|uniref:hypothetical protein n=1 Tax=Microbacterium sulfonylureivorans TaxID=2486854 RepID=UPI000FDA265F|nr:hypothetical protein [Microbacterium sulfonylureivorans]